MNRITVPCTAGCGTQIETSISHKGNAMCQECRRKSNIASTRRAQLRRQGKTGKVEVMTAERIKDYCYWGN